MKNILKLTLVLAMVFTSTTVFAQKIARVNTQEIFAIMPDTKQMEENLNAFGQELQAQLEAARTAHAAASAKLDMLTPLYTNYTAAAGALSQRKSFRSSGSSQKPMRAARMPVPAPAKTSFSQWRSL